MAGLVPAISIKPAILPLSRDKPGDDGLGSTIQIMEGAIDA
jgi:hypothetical protein